MKIDKIHDSSNYRIINKDLMLKNLNRAVVADFKKNNKIILSNMAAIYKEDENIYKIFISDNQLDDFTSVTIRTREGCNLIKIFMTKDEFINFFGMIIMRINLI